MRLPQFEMMVSVGVVTEAPVVHSEIQVQGRQERVFAPMIASFDG